MRPCYILIAIALGFLTSPATAQLHWQKIDTGYGQLPASVALYKTTDSLGGEPNIAYYLEADLSDRNLEFTTDTSFGRRLTPTGFANKNGNPLAIVNTTFFSFETHQNLGLVIRKSKLLSYNINSIYSKADSQFHYVLPGSFGIRKNRKADIAYVFTDSVHRRPYTLTFGAPRYKTGKPNPVLKDVVWGMPCSFVRRKKRWRMETAVAGGPVLIQQGEIRITNEEERKFMGNAINDRHPRTAIGYTAAGKLIILVIEGRHEGKAAGATLTQEAMILRSLGCVEALNLDGGGSSCLLVNGRETIAPSDSAGQRAIPGILLIRSKINP